MVFSLSFFSSENQLDIHMYLGYFPACNGSAFNEVLSVPRSPRSKQLVSLVFLSLEDALVFLMYSCRGKA